MPRILRERHRASKAFVEHGLREAIVLRPDVPAVQHTRARPLLAVGRIDDAIAVLDAMRTDYRDRARIVAR